MKENRLAIFAIVSMVCIGIILFFSFGGTGKRYSWFESYRAESNQPYGALFIRKLLEGYRSGEFTLNTKEPLKKVLDYVEYPGQTDYVFIGHGIFLDAGSTYALARFIEAGGNAFIASLAPPWQILQSAYFQECGVQMEYDEYRATSAGLNFFHPALHREKPVTFGYRFGTNEFPYLWHCISEKVFCDSTRSIVALGYQDRKRVNFVRVSVGKGNLYLHTNPLVFTNYFLTDKEKLDYASAVFSHLDGKDIIWDEFSKIPLPGGNAYNSPLYYILDQPALKYAWWLLLMTVLIYVFFAAKRKQRAIPVMEPKTNTSLEFVNMISRLHYKNGNHLDMAHKKMRYFLYFVRSKYGIHAGKFGDEQIRRLAEKSRVDFADVHVIFSRYYLIEERFRNNIEANRLADLCDSIDNFYRQSK